MHQLMCQDAQDLSVRFFPAAFVRGRSTQIAQRDVLGRVLWLVASEGYPLYGAQTRSPSERGRANLEIIKHHNEMFLIFQNSTRWKNGRGKQQGLQQLKLTSQYSSQVRKQIIHHPSAARWIVPLHIPKGTGHVNCPIGWREC